MPYSKMKLAVGLFVLTFFIAFGIFSYLLLEEKGTFEKRHNYHFDTVSANSFNIGMPLKLSGFEIGVIDDIVLKDDGTVHMTFSVNEENKKWISEDSVLMVRKPLIGSPHIEVYSAIGNKPLEAGSTLVILISDDINDMISKLEPAVNSIINIINSVEKLSSKLANDDSLLTSITGDKESTLSIISSLNSTAATMKEIHIISKDISKITKSLDEDLINPSSSAIKELDVIMKDVKEKLELIDGTVKSVGSYDNELNELKEQIRVGIKKSNKIMDKLDSIISNEQNSEVPLP